MNRFEFNRGERSESIVRQVAPEDPYDDRSYLGRTMRGAYTPTYAPPSLSSASSRQISQTSSTGTAATGMTMQSGSENWETFSEQSDEMPEEEVDFHAYRRQMKRYTPDGGHGVASHGLDRRLVGTGLDDRRRRQVLRKLFPVRATNSTWTLLSLMST